MEQVLLLSSFLYIYFFFFLFLLIVSLKWFIIEAIYNTVIENVSHKEKQ